MPPWLNLLVLSCTTIISSPSLAQVTVIQDDENNVTTYQMTVSPAPESEPAFKYRFLKHENDRKEGNAAPFYYRAMLDEDRIQKTIRDKYRDAYYDWLDVKDFALADLPLEKIRSAPDVYRMVDLREATSRSRCDWGWGLEHRRGTNVFHFLIEEVQKGRGISRMLVLKTRLALAEQRLDDAFEFTQMNYQLGRDVASEPFIVCSLVGVAISGMSNSHTLEFMAAPNAPNLYWAFAELPNPLIDIRPAMRFELGNGPRVFPLLRDVESVNRSPEEWSRYIGEAWLSMLSLSGGLSPSFPDGVPEPLRGPPWIAVWSRLIGTGTGLLGYTSAKKQLIKSGMSIEEINAMPVGQVVALQASRAYRYIAHNFEKSVYVPFHQAGKMERTAEDRFHDKGFHEVIPIASLLMPAMQAARTAQERLTRDLAAMHLIEALRMHAAATGTFPAALDDITVVPVPRNPATGKAFEYRLDGKTAILGLPTTDGFHVGKRYEITLR